MIEVFLFGIVLGLIPITLAGLFVGRMAQIATKSSGFYFKATVFNVFRL